MLTAEGRLVFLSFDDAFRTALYSSDGNDLKQLAVFPAGFQDEYGYTAMVEAGGVVYFRVFAPGHRQLWRSDSKSAAGTRLVYDFGDAPILGPVYAAGDEIYFPAETPAAGSELWVSDGTPAGTRMVLDARPGPAGGAPAQLRALPDRRLVFSLDDGQHGREPWITDGTAAGTRLLEDVRPGPESSNPATFIPVANLDRLFFVGNDATGRPVPSFLETPIGPNCPNDRGCRQNGRF